MPSAPKLPWRLATLLGLWYIIFGMIIAINPVPMEAGYDVTHENFGAILMSPLLGCMGLATFLGGPRSTVFEFPALILSLLLILGSTALMLFRCRSLRTFWTLTIAHAIIITAAGFGFVELARYWCENP